MCESLILWSLQLPDQLPAGCSYVISSQQLRHQQPACSVISSLQLRLQQPVAPSSAASSSAISSLQPRHQQPVTSWTASRGHLTATSGACRPAHCWIFLINIAHITHYHFSRYSLIFRMLLINITNQHYSATN